jgi:thioredoxin-like negative regulator of GroEL
MKTEAPSPSLVFFHSEFCGRSRRAEGFLAQVLQRRHNHGTFKLYHVEQSQRPDLAERFGVETVPTIVVVDGRRVRARIVRPRGCHEIEEALAPWLR